MQRSPAESIESKRTGVYILRGDLRVYAPEFFLCLKGSGV